jgi:hypothetical protein
MTVQQDLEKARASALAAQGSYATFASSTQDQTAKQMFQQMEQDMTRHIAQIDSRLAIVQQSSLNANNKQRQ